jgi:membrane-bound ClpP family serine protease
LLQSVFLQIGDLGSLVLLVVFIIVIAALFLYFVVWALKRKPVTGMESLKGKIGVALVDMSPNDVGEVSVDGVIWKAMINEGGSRISKGESVVVIGISSLTLFVQKREK